MRTLKADASTLLIVDFQEKLFAAMPEGWRDTARKNAEILLYAAREHRVPLLATEQYPHGLGSTLTSMELSAPYEKMSFSALREPGFPRPNGRVVVLGIETHICVLQTVADLLDAKREVVVVSDACLARTTTSHEAGLRRMERWGAEIATSEMVAFEWMSKAGTPVFKEIQKRFK